VAELSQQPEIWKVLSRIWNKSSLPPNEIAVTLATLIYLRWADFQEAEQEAIAAFDGTDYKPILPSSLHWRSWHLLAPHDLQELFTKHLPGALQRLNNSRHISLATHLHRITSAVKNIGRLSPQALRSLIHWLAEQPFETPRDRRALLDSFDVVLDKSRDKHSGEYRTPAAIAQLLVSLAAPSAGERVYDPCFGSAGLLTAAFDYVRSRATEQFSRSGSPALSISGVEINLEAYIIGLVRLTLAGVVDPQIELGNSLERVPSSTPQRDGFDIVLANPPWGMRADPVGIDHFAVRTTDATGLFIQHALAQLRANGRAVIVVPQGVLFRGGPEQRLRLMLLEQHAVEAVVSLPHGVFLPYTGIQASIFVLRKSGPTKSIRMIDAEPFFEKGRGNLPASIHQDMVEDLARQLREPQPGKHCWDVDPETLAQVDWDFTPKRRDQSGLTGILDALRTEIEVVSLSQCCTISSGRAVPRDQLLDTPPFQAKLPEQEMLFPEAKQRAGQLSIFDVTVIPYVRIKDIQRGQASGGSSWISPATAASVDARWKLKSGDILLSKSGTIGKAGVVRNGAVGAIPAAGLFVLRPDPDRLDPHFLLAYLESAECRSWLDEKARGATIRHLSAKALEELPVPLPPFQIQQRVAADRRERGGDALAFLAQLLTQGEQDPITAWADKTVNDLPLDIDALNDPMDLSPLDRLAVDAGEIRNRALHESQGESALAPWLIAFSEALSGLRGIDAVPRGPGLLSVLQETARALSLSIALIKGHLPSETAARDLNQRVAKWIDHACSALLARVELLVGTDTSVLPAGEMVQVELNVWNRGPLPLRNLRVSTRPDWGGGSAAYLAENARTTIVLSGVSPKKPGRFTLAAVWSVDTLDGKTVDGVREIAFNFVEKTSALEPTKMDIGGSPYVCGDPVRPDRNDVFFGREELLEQIRRQIVFSGNVVLLEGNRRSGKSSVLWHLEGVDSVPGWLGVYCSLQGAEGSREGVGVPTTEVFREMAKSIAKGLQALGETTPLPDGTALLPGRKLGIAGACRAGIDEASPFADFRDYLDVALDMLAGRQLGLLLMLDEFDKLQEGIDSGVTTPQVPENIRFLVQTYPRFCAILTGSRRLKRLREEHWSALYGLGTRFGVTSLPVEHARRLVTEPVKGRLIYSPEAVERSIFLTSGQPYLLQCLCNRVFDMAAQLKMRSVTLDLVHQAGDALVQDNEHFASLWDYAGSDRRRFLLALCHKESGSPDALRLGVIQERLLVHGIEINDETLIADLEYLRELELVELVGEPGGGHYALAIPLMGTWIEKQQDFAAIKRKAKLETEDQHE
jgi:type I restriction enzyme M protein